ncbi:MAG: PDZ domain-containing protein [Opitutaceae bacterium]
MNTLELPKTPRLRMPRGRGLPLYAIAIFVLAGPIVAQEATERPLEDVTTLPPFTVKGARMEDFGFRYNVTIAIPGPDFVIVSEIFPNTPAAKAGLRPGDQVFKVDGKAVSAWSAAFKPTKVQDRKCAELAAGKPSVSLTLEVGVPKTKARRTVVLTIPSAAPHWGSDKWSAPEGREPAVVEEAGPLAALAREVLDNGIWSQHRDRLGYEWRIVQPAGTHRIWVTQSQGKTEIRLEHRSPSLELESSSFVTSPSGAMDEGRSVAPKIKGKRREISAEEVRAAFEAEIDFWLHKVGRVTGRWPFEALSGKTETITSAVPFEWNRRPSRIAAGESEKMNAPLAESFLKLPVATATQKELFFAALGKVGLDGDGWAYTETSRSLDGDRVTTVRYDPSKPEGESSILLKVDGKAPKPAYLQQWRAEGHEPLPGLAELPPLSTVVDTNDVRIFADETAAVVFELPVKANNAEFPADKFQARFRVNKTHRGFEDFSVKLRESMRMAGVVKVTEAGLEARFQTFDPAFAPQPVFLKMGGGVRVLLVKVSRAFEVTRTDFKRVVPFASDTARPEK